MPWIYRQSTGDLFHDSEFVEKGYSGHGNGKNNPAMQEVQNVGPIPRGTYRIGPPHNSPHVGPYALLLSPAAGTNTFGRSAFYMHGDSVTHPGSASDGCIIMRHTTRVRVVSSGDRELRVEL